MIREYLDRKHAPRIRFDTRANLCAKTFTRSSVYFTVSGSSKKEKKRFNLSFRATHFCLSRPCCDIASFLIVTKKFASSVLITDDDVAVTWLRIMLKPLSRKSQELFARR